MLDLSLLVVAILENFPHETVPDGMIDAPHHYYYPALAALPIIMTVWDDYRGKEPIVPVLGLLLGLFAFRFMWPVPGYHTIGAGLALFGPVLALLSVLNPRGTWLKPTSSGGYPWRTGALASILILATLDDAIEHAFGVWTPLDWMFGVMGVWKSFLVAVFVVLAAVSVLSIWERVPWGERYGG